MLNYKQIWHGIKPIRWLNKFNLTVINFHFLGCEKSLASPLRSLFRNVHGEVDSGRSTIPSSGIIIIVLVTKPLLRCVKEPILPTF